jgi:hypothetical protein
MAAGNEPLRLADGRLVYPGGRIEEVVHPNANGGNARLIEVPTNREAQQLVINARRKLADLPEVPRTMNAVGVVLSYTLFGLDDMDIALAIGSTETQVARIKDSAPYKTMYENVIRSILDAETDVVRDIFKQHSRTAANVLVDSLHNGARGERLLAAKDFLDRSGHRPSDIIEHRHVLDGGLTIEIVRRDNTDTAPIVDMELE